MIIQGASQVTLVKQIKKAVKRHFIAFNSFSFSSEEIMISIIDYEWNRFMAFDQCCWGAIGIATILIVNPQSSCHGHSLIIPI